MIDLLRDVLRSMKPMRVEVNDLMQPDDDEGAQQELEICGPAFWPTDSSTRLL